MEAFKKMPKLENEVKLSMTHNLLTEQTTQLQHMTPDNCGKYGKIYCVTTKQPYYCPHRSTGSLYLEVPIEVDNNAVLYVYSPVAFALYLVGEGIHRLGKIVLEGGKDVNRITNEDLPSHIVIVYSNVARSQGENVFEPENQQFLADLWGESGVGYGYSQYQINGVWSIDLSVPKVIPYEAKPRICLYDDRPEWEEICRTNVNYVHCKPPVPKTFIPERPELCPTNLAQCVNTMADGINPGDNIGDKCNSPSGVLPVGNARSFMGLENWKFNFDDCSFFRTSLKFNIKGFHINETMNYFYNIDSSSFTVNATGFNSTFSFSKLFNKNEETFQPLSISYEPLDKTNVLIHLDIPLSSIDEGDVIVQSLFEVDHKVNDCLDVGNRCGPGVCEENFVDFGYLCNCDDTGYEGEHCEIEVNECVAWNPCTRNSKSCTDLINDFICECDIG